MGIIDQLGANMHELCKGEEHNRHEIVTDLQDNKKFRAVGVCQFKGCGTKRFYPHFKDNDWNTVIVPSHNRNLVSFRVKKERAMQLHHGLRGGM